jgi:hypothetical protein
MLILLFASIVYFIASAQDVDWGRSNTNAKFYIAGVYYCTRTGNLAAAVIHNGKQLSPHYAKSAKPTLIITYDGKASIREIIAVDAKFVYFAGGGKLETKNVRVLCEGDYLSAPPPYSFVGTDGRRVILGANYSLSSKALRRKLSQLGFNQLMRLDGGSATYASPRYSKRLNNFICAKR